QRRGRMRVSLRLARAARKQRISRLQRSGRNCCRKNRKNGDVAQRQKVGSPKWTYSAPTDLHPREIGRPERQKCCSRRGLLRKCGRKHEAANLEAARARRMGEVAT